MPLKKRAKAMMVTAMLAVIPRRRIVSTSPDATPYIARSAAPMTML